MKFYLKKKSYLEEFFKFGHFFLIMVDFDKFAEELDPICQICQYLR